jgi:acetyltransferase-like isoleucine patch superfamily enzyme
VNRDVPPNSLVRGVPARVDDAWAERRATPDDDAVTDEPGDRTGD